MVIVEYFCRLVFEKFWSNSQQVSFYFKYDAFAAIAEESEKMTKNAELQIVMVKAESAKERKE